MPEQNYAPIDPAILRSAAEEAASPVAVVERALSELPDNPAPLFTDSVIEAFKAIHASDPVTYSRLLVRAKGYINRIEKLTAVKSSESEKTLADKIVPLLRQSCELTHNPDGRGVAIINDNGKRQVWYIDSAGFQDWVRAKIYSEIGSAPSESTLATILGTLSAIGKFDGQEVNVNIRCAKHGDSYFIDLCNEAWQVVQISQNGWQVLDQSPVYFTRNSNLRPLPTPERDGEISALWLHLNIPENRRLQLLAWILDAYRPDTPFPVLELTGEQGSSKSWTQRRIRDLVDPNKVALRGRPKSVEDVYVAASNNWMVSFENLSHLTPEQQDALCTLATGSGFATRQLYTNGEEFVLETKRPVVLNGINTVASQPDLIERTISIDLPTISSEARSDEQTLQVAWNNEYPRIFGAILTLFSQTLAALPNTRITEKFRMADYQLLGEAMASAMGESLGSFSKKYEVSVTEGVERGLESYGVANALRVFMSTQGSGWEGTVLKLYVELLQIPGADRSNWPRSARGLAGQLKRITPAFRSQGLLIKHLGHGRDGARIRIEVKGSREDE